MYETSVCRPEAFVLQRWIIPQIIYLVKESVLLIYQVIKHNIYTCWTTKQVTYCSNHT